jgi:hypothetical protein
MSRRKKMDSNEQTTTNAPTRETTVYEKALACLIILVSLAVGLGGICANIIILSNGAWTSRNLQTLFIALIVLTGGATFGYRVFISPVFWDRPFGKLAKIALIPSLILLLVFLFQ